MSPPRLFWPPRIISHIIRPIPTGQARGGDTQKQPLHKLLLRDAGRRLDPAGPNYDLRTQIVVDSPGSRTPSDIRERRTTRERLLAQTSCRNTHGLAARRDSAPGCSHSGPGQPTGSDPATSTTSGAPAGSVSRIQQTPALSCSVGSPPRAWASNVSRWASRVTSSAIWART